MYVDLTATQPRIGTSFVVSLLVSGCATGRFFPFLLTGVSNTSWNGVSLPTNLPFMLSCPLRVSPDVIMLLKTPYTTTFQLPNSTSLLGARFYQQALGAYTLWSWTPPMSWVSSRGGVGVIGR